MYMRDRQTDRQSYNCIYRHCEVTKTISVALLLYPGVGLTRIECKQRQNKREKERMKCEERDKEMEKYTKSEADIYRDRHRDRER